MTKQTAEREQGVQNGADLVTCLVYAGENLDPRQFFGDLGDLGDDPVYTENDSQSSTTPG